MKKVKLEARCNNSSGCPLGNKYIVIAVGEKLMLIKVSK